MVPCAVAAVTRAAEGRWCWYWLISGPGAGLVTSIERTAYPRFKRLITAHELRLFFAPTREEAAWAAERMDSDGHQLALLLALKSYQRMGRFPKPDEYPEMVIDFVRRTVELPEGTLPLYETGRTAERQRTEVRQRVGTKYQQSQARQIAEAAIRKEAAAKNRPADLIDIALEKVVVAGLELPVYGQLGRDRSVMFDLAGWSSPPRPRTGGCRLCSRTRCATRAPAASTSPRSARRSTPTGPSNCSRGRTSRRSWPITWWRSGCARRARPVLSTRRRMPGTRTTRAWSSTRRPASRH
ncbi:DUF4158 domain-containing protein [Streptomyces acidiscabies]|uniref:DUF4158 domain-containing protein n=1 Tax=Streptomyces acidiscabies TaxID=42234 RepID=UPI0038F7AE5B